jgi:multiple sugar transport system substrate-binding protein
MKLVPCRFLLWTHYTLSSVKAVVITAVVIATVIFIQCFPLLASPCLAAEVSLPHLNVIYMAQAGYQPEHFREMTREFTRRHGIEVVLNIVRYDEEYQKIVTSATSPVATYDVVLVDLIWVAEFAKKKYVSPLDRGFVEKTRQDIPEIILDAFEYAGRIWAMPFLANIHFLFYNDDMLRQAGFSGLPGTIEEMEAQMRELKTRGIVKYPMIASWNQKEGLICEYVWMVGAYGGELFDSAGEPVFHRGPGVLALDTMVRWVRDGLINPLALTADELLVKDIFISGKAAFAPNWTFLNALMNDGQVSQVAGKARIGLLPVADSVRYATGRMSSSVSGFQGLAVMSNSSRKQEAWQYIEFMTSPDMQGRFLQEVPVWISLHTSPEAKEKDPDIDMKLSQLEWLHHRPKLVRYQEISAIMQKFIHAALEGTMSPQEALDVAADRARQLR